jgi:CSLREA domain-containing protein
MTMMPIRISLHVLLAGAAIAGATACRDATAPVRPLPRAAQFAAQPSKNVWTVTTLDDPGSGICTSSGCTLRDAITAAQTGDRIVFKSSVSGTIALTSTLLLSKGLTIDGANRITLDAQSISDRTNARVFVVMGQGNQLIGLTMTHGSTLGDGGVVYSSGELTVSDSRIISGSATRGGGIQNFTGSLTIVRTTVADNSAQTGGGIYSEAGSLTVIASTVSGNQAPDGGAGIYNYASSITVRASTVSGNSAGVLSTGGIATNLGDMTLTSSTVVNNAGWGISAEAATISIRNSILAGNVVTGVGPSYDDCAIGAGGAIHSFGYNIGGSTGCSAYLNTSTDRVIDPAQVATEVLDPVLRDNGGPTKTHALIERGLAVDAGYCPGETTDQRGFVRPYDDTHLSNAADACDIGAFEWQPPGTKRSK